MITLTSFIITILKVWEKQTLNYNHKVKQKEQVWCSQVKKRWENRNQLQELSDQYLTLLLLKEVDQLLQLWVKLNIRTNLKEKSWSRFYVIMLKSNFWNTKMKNHKSFHSGLKIIQVTKLKSMKEYFIFKVKWAKSINIINQILKNI
jgi:hypothetical protein